MQTITVWSSFMTSYWNSRSRELLGARITTTSSSCRVYLFICFSTSQKIDIIWSADSARLSPSLYILMNYKHQSTDYPPLTGRSPSNPYNRFTLSSLSLQRCFKSRIWLFRIYNWNSCVLSLISDSWEYEIWDVWEWVCGWEARGWVESEFSANISYNYNSNY